MEPDLKNSEQAAALLLALNGLGSEDTLSLSTPLVLARSTPAMYFLPAASPSSMVVLGVGRDPRGPLCTGGLCRTSPHVPLLHPPCDRVAVASIPL